MLNLHVNSVYSYKKAIAKIEQIAEKSLIQNETSFCITDIGSVTSFAKAFLFAKNKNMKFIPGIELEIKPIDKYNKIWVKNRINFLNKEKNLKRTTEEMYKEYEKELTQLNKTQTLDSHSLILLAYNYEGLKNIINLFSNQEQIEDGIFQSTNDLVEKHKEGIIVLSGSINSEVLFYIRNKEFDKARNLLEYFKNVFKNNFYAQLEYHSFNLTESEEESGILTEVEAYNKFIDICNDLNIEFVVTNHCRYIEEKDRRNYCLFKNIYNDEIEEFNYKNNHFRDEKDLLEEMLKVYDNKAVLSGFENIKKIENQCEKIEFPLAPSLVDCNEELERMCKEGWNKLRKGTDKEQESKERYLYELSVIKEKNFSQYFIKVKNIVDTAHNLGIIVGPGRGSGCGSELCYLLGITKVDPLEYTLFFERFLNPDRHGYPDVDLDLSSIPLSILN